jgi:glucose-6-phosphate isomerase
MDDALWAQGEDLPSTRLGWLHLHDDMRSRTEELRQFAAEVVADGFSRVVLLGMGGSSLAPEMFASMFHAPGYPELVVLDSTHPDQIHTVTEYLDLSSTLFVVASKSGTTTETLSLYRYFRNLLDAGDQYVAITDPGSPLETLAASSAFRRTYVNPPDVGGRYSALSLFGLVPAALAGADLDALLDSARAEANTCKLETQENRAAVLGLTMARAVRSGRDKLTFVTTQSLSTFCDWVEQLLAESTGKRGTGIVPIVHEPPLPEDRYGSDRRFVGVHTAKESLPWRSGGDVTALRVELESAHAVGAEIFRWEFATAIAGVELGINPFDQPDVESAKRAARAVLGSSDSLEWTEDDPDAFFDAIRPPEYAAILAFAPVDDAHRRLIDTARGWLGRTYGVATVGAFGPRYLHSSGQLYKGGPRTIRALVVLDRPIRDISIPGEEHGFSRLVTAQAVGDALALREAGQKVATATWEGFASWVEELPPG